MKHFQSIILIVSTILGLTTCGDRNLAELDSKQSADFKETVGELSRALSATQAVIVPSTAKSEGTASPRSLFEKSHSLAWLGLQDVPVASKKALKGEIQDALQNGRCEKTIPKRIPTSNDMIDFWGLKTSSLTFKVWGANCPIDYSDKIELQVNREARLMRATQARAFELREELRGLSDIYKVTLATTFELQLGKALTLDISRGEMNLGGSFSSTQRGNASFYLKMKGQGVFKDGSARKLRSGDGEIRFGVEFPQYTGELRAVAKLLPGESEPSVEYFVNDRTVTEKEIGTYFK